MKRIKQIVIILLIGLLSIQAKSQVIISEDAGATINTSAILDVQSTTKGLLIPSMTTSQMNALAGTSGLLIFNTDENAFYYYTISWNKIATGDNTSQWTTSSSDIYYENGVAIGNTYVDNSAILDISSTSKGVLIPRMSQSERESITQTQGLLVYQNDNTDGFYYSNGSEWRFLFNSSSSVLPVSQGGTGNSAFTAGNIIYGGTSLSSSTNLTYASNVLKITNGTLNVDGGTIQKVSLITATSSNLNSTNNVVICKHATSVITINLPAVSSNNGRVYTIRNIGSQNVTIDPAGSTEQIEKNTTYTLAPNKSVIILCYYVVSGADNGWYIISGF